NVETNQDVGHGGSTDFLQPEIRRSVRQALIQSMREQKAPPTKVEETEQPEQSRESSDDEIIVVTDTPPNSPPPIRDPEMFEVEQIVDKKVVDYEVMYKVK